MVDVWLFGTFASANNNLDPAKTADRLTAKWRSQVKVPQGHQAFAPFQAGQTNYVVIGTSAATATVKAVYISDLEYQLRNTDPITDQERWIRSVNSGTVGGFQYITCYRLGTTTEFAGFSYTPSATNPNSAQFVKPTPTPKALVNLGYLSFAEVRLDLGYDYGAVGGMGYETEITEVADDREQRNATRYLPKGRWQLGDRLIAESEADLLAEVSYLKQFHLDRLGSFQGFRFKDWSDFQATNQDIATGNAVKTQFQLRKAYKVGNIVTYRPIQKPVVGTVDILVNGVNVATIANHGWVVNHETGVLSNPTPLASGAKLTANFQFDVPVWFESDEIGFSLQAYEPESKAAIYRLESVFVIEGKIPPAITWDVQALTEITEELDLGIIYDTVEQYQFSTVKQELKSGYAIRESKREDSRLLVNLGGRNYDQEEVDKILAYFWNARGSLTEFPFKNLGKSYKVRFDQDQLNFKFEAASDSDKFFNLSGLKLQLKEAPIYRIPPYTFSLTKSFVDPQNPSDPSISSSNPGTGGNFGGSFGGSGTTKPFNVASYSVPVGFNSPPSGSTVSADWRGATMFWAAGTLWLFVWSNYNNASNLWYGRCAVYKLSAAGNFEYVDSSLKNCYTVYANIADQTLFKVLKTPTGVSMFFLADNSVPFGSGQPSPVVYKLIRFEIKDDGTQFIDVLPNSLIPVANATFSKVVAVYGADVLVDSQTIPNTATYNLGTINGLQYYVGKFSSSSASGYPVPQVSASSQAINRDTYPNNLEIEFSNTTKKHSIFFNNALIKEYYSSSSTSSAIVLNNAVRQNQEGVLFAKLRVNQECNNGATSCVSANAQEQSHIWIASSYAEVPSEIDKLPLLGSSLNANYNFSQAFSSGTSQKINNDKFGNLLVIYSSGIWYYQAKSSNAINITSHFPTGTKLNDANTPYGFGVFSFNSQLFAATSNPTVIFVQPQSA